MLLRSKRRLTISGSLDGAEGAEQEAAATTPRAKRIVVGLSKDDPRVKEEAEDAQQARPLRTTATRDSTPSPPEDDGDARLDSLLPMTHGSACGLLGIAQQYSGRDDLQAMRLHRDHARRPIWVCPGGRIIFEATHPQAAQVTDFLIAIAEPISRPEIVHEYQITVLSLSAAVSTGIEVDQIIKLLVGLAKNILDEEFLHFVAERGRTIGKLKMVLRNNRHFLESADRGLLRKLCSDVDIAASLVRRAPGAEDDEQAPAARGSALRGGDAGTDENIPPVEVDSLRVEAVKSAAHRLHLPLLQEYEYRQDHTENNPELHATLRPSVNVRPYQQRALSKMFAVDGVAKSGIVVLPCGAGKTLVGIAACVRIGRRCLVLTTTSVAVDQWRRQFQMWTSIPPEDVYVLTAEQKRPIEDSERRACVVISTYSMMGFTGKRGAEAELILSQIQQLEWGLLVVDEVQVMPARTFRTVATTVKAHCCMGLTATLVREDNLIYDLHWLIGPKLYEASWQQLQDDGFIARVRCVEVWCEMSKAFFAEFLKAGDDKDAALRRALWTCNPNKLKVCEYLIRFHEQRGDKTIVFSDNIFILEEFAKRLGRYYICGKVDMRERMQILGAFQESSSCNTIFLSKVGDNAIDIPAASVIIQISAHYGSRRQEAQRLGRILRPKPKAFNTPGKFNAFFYSLVSRDTQEMYYANKRQQFLVEQGYNYHVLRDHSVERMDDRTMAYASEEAQLHLLKQVLESVRRGEGMEGEEEDVALSGPVPTGSPPAQRTSAGPAGGTATEERVSMASLSGALDGSYSVTPVFNRKLKPGDL